MMNQDLNKKKYTLNDFNIFPFHNKQKIVDITLLIGSGNFGKVYLASYNFKGNIIDVAIKLV